MRPPIRLISLLLLALVLLACSPIPVPLPALDGAEPAPNLTLPTPSGGTLSLPDLRGKVVFVNFWGHLLPALCGRNAGVAGHTTRLPARGGGSGGVNVEEKPEKVAAWTKARHHLSHSPIG